MTSPQVELPPLPKVDTRSLALSGRDLEYINGYEAGFERALEHLNEYATAAVLKERERCAKVAENSQAGDGRSEARNVTARRIAAAIRNP